MNNPITETSPRMGKRSANSPQTKEGNDGDAINITPGSSAKKKRLKTSGEDTPSTTSDPLRAWSNRVNESSDTSTIYTLKCTFGNPSNPLSYFIRSSKVGFIKEMLEMRNLSTHGSKAVLLQRLQTDLPSVT